MWWGGSEEEQVGSPPPADTQSESQVSTEDPKVVKQELGDLKEQFNQQQALIGQLKGMLKEKDASLTSREKEVEDLGVRLARIKPRLDRGDAKKRATQQAEKGEQRETGESSSAKEKEVKTAKKSETEKPVEKRLPSSESSSRAKILLLRKQLEENRLKFERQQKDNAEKRATMEEMKQRIDKLRSEVEQRDSLIHSLQEGSSSMSDETMTQKLLQQILYKDNTLLELTQKVKHLEEVVQEHQESLNEKDRVIESRTEAVTLVAKAENEKNLKTLQELEEVRYQMKKMQEEFITKEEEFINEKESLRREINEKSKKVKQLEDNGRRLENLRFELSTRNAELQEKIVTMQSDIKSLRNQAEIDRNVSEEKDNLMQDLKQKLVKAESHGQKKLKALEKQLKGLKQDGNSGEQILLLQNSIAELEEEKGNLQLKLVDFDDLKATNEKLISQRNKLEEKIKLQNNDLDSQLSAITLLETEKIKLVEGINERENRIYDLETELTGTKLSLTENKQAKVTLELKLCEIEEQRDMAEKAKSELQGQMSESNIISNDQLKAEKASLEETIQTISKERNEWQEKYNAQIAAVEECKDNEKLAVAEMEEKSKECKRLMNILTDKENDITTMSIKMDKHDSVIASIEEKLSFSMKEADDKKLQLEEINKVLISEKEIKDSLKSQLEAKSNELIAKEDELKTVSQHVETLNRSVNERNISIQNLVGEVSSLQEEIKTKDKSINDHINRLEELEIQMHQQDSRLEEFHSLCMQKDQQLNEGNNEILKLKHDLNNLTQKYETTKSSLESELNITVTMMNDYSNQLESANGEIKVKEKEIQNNQIVISKYEEEICSKNRLMDEIETKNRSLQQSVNELNTVISEKTNYIVRIQAEMEEHTNRIENLNEANANLEKSLKLLQEERSHLSQMKVTLEEEVNETKSLVHQKEENLLNMNTELNKYQEVVYEIDFLKQTLEEKSHEIAGLEDTVRSLTSDMERKTSEVEKWQTEALEKSNHLAEVTHEKDVRVSELGTLLEQTQANLTAAEEHRNYLQSQLSEIQELYKLKETEGIEHQNQFSVVEAQLRETIELYETSKEKLNATETELQEAKHKCDDNSVVISRLEEELQSKSTNMKTTEDQMSGNLESSKRELEAVSAELQMQNSRVADLEKEIEANRQYAENLEIGSTKVQEWATELQSELEKIKVDQLYIENELYDTKKELSSRNTQIEKLQLELDQERQSVQSLQDELSHTVSLDAQNKSEEKIISLSQQQKINQLENELLLASQARDHLQAAIEEKNQLLQTQSDLTIELNGSIDSLKQALSSKDEEIQMLRNTLPEQQKTEAEFEESLKDVKEMKDVLEDNIPSQSQPDQKESVLATLKNDLSEAQDKAKLLEMERTSLCADVNTLKQQLQEARLTITQLQTSLASSVTPQPNWDEWGEVDLSSPDSRETFSVPESTDVINLQKSLCDKDELLRMIQDQLKDALQEVNTFSEEKKVLEQQRKSDEGVIAQQLQQYEKDQNEISLMKSQLESLNEVKNSHEQVKQRIVELEEQLDEKHKQIEALQLQVTNRDSYGSVQDRHHHLEPSNYEFISSHCATEPNQALPSIETEVTSEDNSVIVADNQTPALQWEHPTVDTSQSVPSSLNEVEQDPANWFDQEHQTLPAAETTNPQEVANAALQEHTEPLYQSEVDIEEIQYKLSWYEEQWSTWTGHYTQLQETHQEALQQIAQLTQQVQELQLSESLSVDAAVKDTPCATVPDKGEDASDNQQQIKQLQDRLSELETIHKQVEEENSELQERLKHFKSLETETISSADSSFITSRLAKAEEEVDRLRGFETQVYELQSQIQAFQHQCDAMQNKLAEAENERTRLHEIEVLYGELQSCIQESETKREGSKSRVQELELMVQSAESEISRLRNEIEVLSHASEVVQSDREKLQTDAHGLGAEVNKLDCEIQHLQSEVKKYKKEIGKLQNDNEQCKSEALKLQTENEKCKSDADRLEQENENLQGEILRTKAEIQHLGQENNQLRSELEVMEGEHGRLQCDYSVLEGENGRITREYEALSHANQMTEAEKESLESEVQRIAAQNTTITSEGKHLRDEVQRLTEVSTSAETEINRQRVEIEKFRSLEARYRELEEKYSELQARFVSLESESTNKDASASEPYSMLEEVEWSAEGQIENEHLLQSSAYTKYQDEIDSLKEKLITLEKEKNSIYDELQAAKLKSGKMLQKLKVSQSKNEALNKEVQKLKAKAGGFSDLDQALEEEWKAQVSKAETERDEMKQKIDEIESEKEHLVNQVDVLTAAQEKYLELKEDQDHTMQLLRARNSELEGQVNALEWKVSELEESLEEHQRTESSSTTSASVERTNDAKNSAQMSEELGTLSDQVSSLQQEIKILKSENNRLQEYNKELEGRITQLTADSESNQTLIRSLQEAKTKTETDINNYKSSYIELDSEHTSLKKENEKVINELKELTYTHDTLEAAYNSMFSEYNDLRDVCDSYKYDIGILKGERDRLVEEVDSQKKQLEALHEEDEEETIRALQDECFSLREQNNLLHEENTALEVQSQDAKDKAARINNALEQNLEVQKLLRDELTKRSEDIAFHTTTIEGQDRQIVYLNAEIAAIKAKLAQHDQAEDSNEELIEALQQKLEQLEEVNEQLQLQVKTAETSLTKLAKPEQESEDTAYSSVNNSELEAALASLHLRDLRCQQLSLEITKLLEERDALQLKLSASLRQTQELSRELSLSHQLPAPASPAPSLHQKLAELRELNDSLEQKALSSLQVAASSGLSQRMSVPGLAASPMFVSHTAPPTPTATRHADYTLTREAQGTSSTLFDWLMGKSTPRVMHV